MKKPEPHPNHQPIPHKPQPLQNSDPGLAGEIASKTDHLAVRLGGARGFWIVLAVVLCLLSSALMMVLPSKTVDVESVYGGF